MAIGARSPLAERQDLEPRSEADLIDFDASFDPALHTVIRRVAMDADTGQIIGYGHAFHMPWSFDPARYWAFVRMDSAYRRRGAGGRLYAELMADIKARGATHVRMMAREEAPAIAAALLRRGFREVLRSWEFELDLSAPGDRLAALNGERAKATIEPLSAVLRRDPDCLSKLRAVYASVMRDVPLPGYLRTEPPLEWFSDYLLHWPTSLPDACFIASDADRFLGISVAHRNENHPGRVDQLLTGVMTEGRSRGIGTAMKLATLAYAKANGYGRIWTAVESNNPRMLALNEAFGFQKTGGLILFEAQLASATAEKS